MKIIYININPQCWQMENMAKMLIMEIDLVYSKYIE